MIAVIFEVELDAAHQADYLHWAERLRGELQQIDGFLSVERFQSLTQVHKLLSLSFWRDETAVAAWRTQSLHRQAQQEGRQGIFKNYRLRVAGVVRDYGMNQRHSAPGDAVDF